VIGVIIGIGIAFKTFRSYLWCGENRDYVSS
jgi:hypothetical protein